MSKLKLDLHDIYNKTNLIDKSLNDIIEEAIDKKIKTVEIIPGKGSGQLKKKVLRFLQQGHIKNKETQISRGVWFNYEHVFFCFEWQEECGWDSKYLSV